MATARYYRFGGEPLNYMVNWSGLPPAANARGSRELGLTDIPPVPTPPFATPPSTNPFGLSNNEYRLAVAGALGLGAFVFMRHRRRRRRR